MKARFLFLILAIAAVQGASAKPKPPVSNSKQAALLKTAAAAQAHHNADNARAQMLSARLALLKKNRAAGLPVNPSGDSLVSNFISSDSPKAALATALPHAEAFSTLQPALNPSVAETAKNQPIPVAPGGG